MIAPVAFLRRDACIALSYKLAFVAQMASIPLAVPLLFFMGRIFGDDHAGPLTQYGGNFFAFLLIGVAFLDYHAVSLKSFSSSLRESQLMGTLELVLLSPTPLAVVLACSSLWAYAFTTIRFLLYLVTGLFLGLDLGQANLLGGLAILIFAIGAFIPFGILSAGTIMLFKRGGGVNPIMTAASLFFGGVLYPTEVLPAWAKPISQMLPITHALRAMRRALLQGASWAELLPSLAILAGFVAVLLPLSLAAFAWTVRRTRISGTIGQY